MTGNVDKACAFPSGLADVETSSFAALCVSFSSLHALLPFQGASFHFTFSKQGPDRGLDQGLLSAATWSKVGDEAWNAQDLQQSISTQDLAGVAHTNGE